MSISGIKKHEIIALDSNILMFKFIIVNYSFLIPLDMKRRPARQCLVVVT